MKIEKFDYYWRIALLIALILGMLFLGNELRKMDKNGLECVKRGPCPISIYQQQIELKEVQEDFKERLSVLKPEPLSIKSPEDIIEIIVLEDN